MSARPDSDAIAAAVDAAARVDVAQAKARWPHLQRHVDGLAAQPRYREDLTAAVTAAIDAYRAVRGV